MDDSMVNTYAWMKATRHSSASRNTPNSTDTTLMEPSRSGPYFAMMKITHTIDRIMMCPASMLAKSRTVRDTGFTQAVVADISEADKLETGESRQGMFYAARTFAFKLGQSAAMLLFTSISLIRSDVPKGSPGYGFGYRLTAIIAALLCLTGGIIFLKYDENKILSRIAPVQKEE